jgi:uncharacterized protein
VNVEWLNVLAGFVVGGVVGLTGVGGGALMTPILVLLFGMAPSVAVGTDLWFAALTKIFGGAIHGSRGSVDWQVARRLWLGSLPAAVLTLLWLQRAGAARHADDTILTVLGIVLLLTAAAMAFKPWLHAWGRSLRVHEPERFKRWQPAATVAAGALLGFLVTLTSIGAGALGAVLLLALYPLRMVPARLVGTDIVHAVPLTLVAGAGHLAMGHVDLPLLGWLLAGSLPGVALGALLSGRVSERTLRLVIAVVLGAVSLKLLV